MNYFDDYYSPEEPREQPDSYIPQEPKAPKVRKERKGFKRLVSVLVVLALVVASCGATVMIMNHHWQKEVKLLMQRMDDKISATHAGESAHSDNSTAAKPASTDLMTPGEVYEKTVNAVVSIMAELDSQGYAGIRYSVGSGFIISDDGYVVTNYHVVEGGKNIIITTYNDESYYAELVGYEPDNDLAVLKVDEEDLPYVNIGSSSELRVGDQVVAIGNALSAFTSSLTVGYVSGVDRLVSTEGTVMNMIQTDVAINSGNSGGPLFNMKGEVVGITTAKFSGESNSGVSIEGIGLAIPMDDVKGMIDDLRTYGYITGAYLGVMLLDVDIYAQFYGLPAGAYVESVITGGAAEKGGIQAGDIITEIGGYDVTSVSELTRVLRKFAAGQTVTVEVYRDGRYTTLSVVLDEKPREEEETQTQQQVQTIPGLPEGGSFEDFYNFFRDNLG